MRSPCGDEALRLNCRSVFFLASCQSTSGLYRSTWSGNYRLETLRGNTTVETSEQAPIDVQEVRGSRRWSPTIAHLTKDL